MEAAGAGAAASSEDGLVVWMLGLIPGTLYIIFNPDGIAHPDRFSYRPWLQALKYTPLPHLASFVFGVLLAELDELIPRPGTAALWISESSALRAPSLCCGWAPTFPTPLFTTAC